MQGGWNLSRKLIKTYPYWLQKLADCFGFVEKLESEEKNQGEERVMLGAGLTIYVSSLPKLLATIWVNMYG